MTSLVPVFEGRGSPTWNVIVRAWSILKEGFKPWLGRGEVSFWYGDWHLEGLLCQWVLYIHILDSELKVRDVWQHGAWHLGRLSTPVCEELVPKLQQAFVWFYAQADDALV